MDGPFGEAIRTSELVERNQEREKFESQFEKAEPFIETRGNYPTIELPNVSAIKPGALRGSSESFLTSETDPIFVALSGGLAYLPVSLSGSLGNLYIPVSLSGSLGHFYLPVSLSGSLPYLLTSLSGSLGDKYLPVSLSGSLGGGSLVLIEHQVVNGANKVQFLNLSGYERYLFLYDFANSAATELYLQLNGYTTGYGYRQVTTTTWSVTDGASGSFVSEGAAPSNNTIAGSFIVTSTPRSDIFHSIIGSSAGPTDKKVMQMGYWQSDAGVTLSGARLITSAAGTTLSGSATCYGIATT